MKWKVKWVWRRSEKWERGGVKWWKVGWKWGCVGKGVCGRPYPNFPFPKNLTIHFPPLYTILRHFLPPFSIILHHSNSHFHHFLPLFISTSVPIPLHHFMFYYLTYSLNEISFLLLTRIMRTYVHVRTHTHIHV